MDQKGADAIRRSLQPFRNLPPTTISFFYYHIIDPSSYTSTVSRTNTNYVDILSIAPLSPHTESPESHCAMQLCGRQKVVQRKMVLLLVLIGITPIISDWSDIIPGAMVPAARHLR